ncbi:patatin-like phospholipase family protein [Crateriforma conspicua]|uniref:patatin-like phospholipase family protein n=1 Tax=Crateriforma conspicua TaxID=2527996 RepID=UPI00118B14F1|nr:patatin-like phospholipase family protein [Crateriforma conspicua]QDV61470.1 Patatin-like phospholipase [Crateriforma conspicua]
MQRLGLALSGGGFRAVLYHLGVVRFLRDAGLLSQVTHITSVSGGSVLAAHLVLNWDRYCGSDEEWQQVAEEILHLVQLDVRNRIVRRFPLASMTNIGRRTLRMSTRRQYTRAGLLEQHYEKCLYGDTSLFNLPERPQLYILATNLSEGSLCAFHRDGLLLLRRTPGRYDRFEKVRMGLATVPMAVAASSAFPGFFPPLELRNWEVGAKEGEFSRLSFTDGGIYDNIGLRMFHHIQHTSLSNAGAPDATDVLDPDAMAAALSAGAEMPENTAMRRLWEKLTALDPDITVAKSKRETQQYHRILIDNLGTIARNDELYRDPIFQEIQLSDPRARALLDDTNTSFDRLESSDRVWLNRQLIAAALERCTGKPCLRSGGDGFDGILVSDAGASFKVRGDGKAGGLFSTAMRSSDILMDRVNQLELESFRYTPGVLFFPITHVVQQTEDSHAPHPEIQHHASLIRTDMDAFSDLEVSALVQHGYCVARQACRERALLPPAEIPSGPPWNPVAAKAMRKGTSAGSAALLSDPGTALQFARRLQQSSSRRILSTLLSFRDWPTYVWMPIVTLLMLTLPYLLYKSNRTATQRGYVLAAVAETSPLYRKILELIQAGPIRTVEAVDFEEVTSMDDLNFDGFEVLSDDRIFDLRALVPNSSGQESKPYVHSRLRVRRTKITDENPHLRFQIPSNDETLNYFCKTKSLRPRHRRMKLADGRYLWELDLDFSSVPLGDDAELVLEGLLISESSEQYADEGRFQFSLPADTGLAQIWMLMPENRNYENFEISGWPIDAPELAEPIDPTTKVELPIGSIATFQLINPRDNFRYECRWKWSGTEQ